MLLDLEVPGCILRRSVRNQLEPLFAGIDDVEESIPSGACGCLTTTITSDGRFEETDLVNTYLIDDPDRLVEQVDS